jgi:hypothetical protein
MHKLAVEDSFSNPVVIHANHVACPTKLGCNQECLHATDLAAFQDDGIGGYILPSNVSKPSEAAQMELIQLGEMPTIKRPGLASV